VIAFEVAGVPAPQGSMRAFLHRRPGRVVTLHDNPRTVVWQRQVKTAACRAVQDTGTDCPWSGPIRVHLEFLLARPRSHMTSDGMVRPTAPRQPHVRPDVDKLARLVSTVHTFQGKEAPVAAWRALRVVAEVGGRNRASGLEPPFIGRQDEFRLLKDLFHATEREKKLRVVSVIGPATVSGSGSSTSSTNPPSSPTSATDASILARENSSISNPWTTS